MPMTGARGKVNFHPSSDDLDNSSMEGKKSQEITGDPFQSLLEDSESSEEESEDVLQDICQFFGTDEDTGPELKEKVDGPAGIKSRHFTHARQRKRQQRFSGQPTVRLYKSL